MISEKAKTAAPEVTNATQALQPRSIALVAVFAALITVAAVVPGIPVGSVGVPITLQTLAVMLTGLCLGPLRGGLAVLLYLAVGFVGFPVFSKGASGLGVLAGPSAGYLVAFLVAAVVVGFAATRVVRHRQTMWAPLFFVSALLTSVVFVHGLGILGMVVNADLSLADAFRADLVFYPGDVIKNLVAASVAAAVHRAFPDLLARRSR